MVKLNLKVIVSALVVVMVFLVTGCSRREQKGEATNSEPSRANVGNPDLEVKGISRRHLDTLWTDSSTFVNLKNKHLVLQYFLNAPDTLILQGWQKKGTNPKFDTLPDIKFLKGRASIDSFPSGFYLGLVILSNREVRSIQTQLDRKKQKYILLGPAVNRYGQISYNVFLSNDNPAEKDFLKRSELISTEITANPCPPRQTDF
jgi:hypothetical protein